jgi:uncharacterized protein YecE (DUF72 family)
MAYPVTIGTAGWTIPSAHRGHFSDDGSHLARYARALPVVEINSTFYRTHRPATFARWAESVPEAFRFCAKLPKEITHERRLVEAVAPLDRFLAEIVGLGDRLGPLLVQFPPGFAYEPAVVEPFFAALRQRFSGLVVCEPRHPTWFSGDVERMCASREIARVAADPPPVPAAAEPGGWDGLVYYRLHGAPQMYFSAYAETYLCELAQRLRQHAEHAPVWCIFDNTAHGHAAANALRLQELVK